MDDSLSFGFIHPLCNSVFGYKLVSSEFDIFDTSQYECCLHKYEVEDKISNDSLIFVIPKMVAKGEKYKIKFDIKNIIRESNFILKYLQLYIVTNNKERYDRKLMKKISFTTIGEFIHVEVEFIKNENDNYFLLNTDFIDDNSEIKKEFKTLQTKSKNSFKPNYNYFLISDEKHKLKPNSFDFLYIIKNIRIVKS